MIIHILNGPNLNLLGKRDPAIYGSLPFETYYAQLITRFPQATLHYMQTNHEGGLIDYLHKFGFEEGHSFILNAGGYSHTSIALRDAVDAINNPVVEVHISDIKQREDFRHHSYLEDVCIRSFIGRGLEGYAEGVEYLLGNRE